jgi:hypothetical protein
MPLSPIQIFHEYDWQYREIEENLNKCYKIKDAISMQNLEELLWDCLKETWLT